MRSSVYEIMRVSGFGIIVITHNGFPSSWGSMSSTS